MTIELPYDLTTSATASATEVMANLNALKAAIEAIGGSQMDIEEPIDKSALADRFVVVPIYVPVVPFGLNTSSVTPVEVKLEGASTRTAGFKVRLGAGQKASLVAIDYRCAAETASGSDEPLLTIKKNTSVTVGAQQIIDTTGSWLEIARLSPVANPLMQLADEDTLDIYLSAESSSDLTTLRGLEVVFHLKVELTA